MSDADPRSQPRFPVSLRVQVKLATGELQSLTDTVSMNGIGVHLSSAINVGDVVPVVLYLRDGTAISADAECRNRHGDRLGFAMSMSDAMARQWRAFVSEEDDTGNLWQLMGRFASTSGAEKEAVRSVLEKHSSVGVLFKRLVGAELSKPRPATMRFHLVGENGEAYRVAFERHGGTPPEKSDLVDIRGFKALAVKIAARVMKNDVTIRRDARAAPMSVRVLELLRGGYAMVSGGQNGVPVAGVSLAVGELILVEVDGAMVFPFFTSDDLERISCDTYRKEERPRASTLPLSAGELPFKEPSQLLPVSVNASEANAESVPSTQTRPELLAVWEKQSQSPRATRRYGDRVIELFPHVWVQANDAEAVFVKGPTMRDGLRLLVLALEGPGAPRVVRLDRATTVALIE